jgi:hypothetical protein
MEQDNAELVKRNLARAEENAFLQARVALLEGQCHTALCRLDDALNFIRGLRQALRESGETRPEINNQIAQNTNRTIELFLEENKP